MNDVRWKPPAIYLVDIQDEFPHFTTRRQNDSDIKYIRSDIFTSLYRRWLLEQEAEVEYPAQRDPLGPTFKLPQGEA